MSDDEAQANTRRIAIVSILVAAALPRLWAAWFDYGVFWPDEIYQTLEQGHRLAFGYGFVSWEFQDGARSWLFPGLLGGLLKIASMLGARDPLVLVGICKTAMAALSLVSVWCAMRIAERIAGLPALVLAGIIAAAFPLSVQFGSRCLAEGASAPLVALAAFLLFARTSSSRRDALIAGALMGTAFVLRYQTAVFSVAFAASLALSKRRPELIALVAGGTITGLLGGALDWATWGEPFHSVLFYTRFMVTAAAAANDPLGYYPHYLFTSAGFSMLAIGAGMIASARRAPAVGAAALAFVLFHELFPHKELRYLAPVIPLIAASAGAGLAMLCARLPAARASMALRVLSLALGGELAIRSALATFGDYGWYLETPFEQRSPWHFQEGVDLALRDAGRSTDLCGIANLGPESLIYAGGYTWLHRDVLIASLEDHPESLRVQAIGEALNYALAPSGSHIDPWKPVSSHGRVTLYRRDGGCIAHPEYDDRNMEKPAEAHARGLKR